MKNTFLYLRNLAHWSDHGTMVACTKVSFPHPLFDDFSLFITEAEQECTLADGIPGSY